MEQIKSNPEAVKKIKALFLWKVTKNGKTVTEWSKLILACNLILLYDTAALDLKNAPGEVYQGAPRNGKVDCTLTMSDEDIIKMASGELDAQKVSNHHLLRLILLI